MLGFPRPEKLWNLVVSALSQVAEEQEPRLRAEAEAFGLDVPALLEFVNLSDPEAALNLYRNANPDLDLSLAKLQELLETDPYRLAVAVLRCMRPEMTASESPQTADGVQQDSSDGGVRSRQSTSRSNVPAQAPGVGPTESPKRFTKEFAEERNRQAKELAQAAAETLAANVKRKYLLS